MERKPTALGYEELDGLSARQLKEHHDVLYTGYVKKWNEIASRLAEMPWENGNGTYSELRELLSELTFAVNGTKLHEAYFANMGGDGSGPQGRIAEILARDFGSVEAFLAKLKAAAICARGWVVLAFDLEEGSTSLITCDAHNQGGIWGCVPLLVLDVYEHAYFLDYGTARAAYVEKFIAAIEWNELNGRIERLGLV